MRAVVCLPEQRLERAACGLLADGPHAFSQSPFSSRLHIAGTSGCNTTGDVWEVVHYTDSALTAPTVVNLTSTNITPLYGPDGALGGLLSLDPISSNVYFYSNEAFTTPATALVAGATSINNLYDDNGLQTASGQYAGDIEFVDVTTASGDALYRISYAGSSNLLYNAAGSLGNGVADSSNLYFSDTAGSETFWSVPLSGGTATMLFSATASSTLIGSNDSLLVFDSTSTSGNVQTTTLQTVSATAPSATANTIGTFTGSINVLMDAPGINNPSADALYVNVANTDAVSGAETFSTEVLGPGGTVTQPLAAGSTFLGRKTFISPSILEIQGITDTNGGYGPGVLNDINMSTLAATPFSNAAGTSYTVPVGSVVAFAPLAVTFAPGVVSNMPSGGSSISSLAADVSSDIVYPITLANSAVAPAF